MHIDARGGCNRRNINTNFFKKWSPQMSYVLGFIFADGSVLNTANSSRTNYLLLSNNNLKLLGEIRFEMSSDHKIQKRESGNMHIKGKEYYCKPSYRIRIGSRELCSDLVGLGVTHRKSLNMKFPHIPTDYISFLKSLSKLLSSSTNMHLKKVYSSDGGYQLRYKKYDSLRILSYMYKNLDQVPYLVKKYETYRKILDNTKNLQK